MTTDDHCYLTDFGLVKDLAATVGGTKTGEVLGTLDYVAPEQIQGGDTGPWTDVYALGCLLFFALTGSVVFPLDVPERKLWAHISEPPPAVSALRSSLPTAVDEVVARALAKDPRERYDGAPAFALALRQALSQPRPAADEDPIGRLVAAARGRDGDGRLTRAADRVAARAQELQAQVSEHPPERIVRELTDLRVRHLADKAERVDALAQQLSTSRKARAGLDALHAGVDGVLVELEAKRDLDAVCDRLEAMARDVRPSG